MINFNKLSAEDIACLLAIIIGGCVSIMNPEYMDDAIGNTVFAIILIKLFW